MKLLRVAALVDLPRSAQSGGHVKCWERLAYAAARGNLPLELTVYFSGPRYTEIAGTRSILRHLPPLISTAHLKFLPYVPDHTDLAPFHPLLARELIKEKFDVLHTTDGFFAFARTAARVARLRQIPLTNSFHTDTPSYTRIFTRQTIEKIFGERGLGRLMVEKWNLPERQGLAMERKLLRHLQACQYALVTRKEDHALAARVLGENRTHHLRLGVDKETYTPTRHDRTGILRDYKIPPDRVIVLFVGRVDIGKNIYTLIRAVEKLIAGGLPLHLIVAGQGPATEDVRSCLKDHVSLPGFVDPSELARLYASANVLTLASEVEIRSMVAVEALASGCPVLVSQKSGIAQLFHHTPAMQEVGSGAENWMAALRNFVMHPERAQAMHKAALDYNKQYLAGWEEVLAEDLLAVWQKAANWPINRQEAA